MALNFVSYEVSSESPDPPPVYVAGPPPAHQPRQSYQPPPKKKTQGLWGGRPAALAVVGQFPAPAAKFGFVIFKFAKLGLLTGGTMLLSVWVYAQIFGWKFAVG